VLNKIIVTNISDLLFEAFFVICPFVRPGKDAGHFNRAILTNKNVLRPDISNFSLLAVEILGSREKGQNEIPEFVLLEKLGTEALSIVDLVREKERINLIVDLSIGECTSTTPDIPQKPSF